MMVQVKAQSLLHVSPTHLLVPWPHPGHTLPLAYECYVLPSVLKQPQWFKAMVLSTWTVCMRCTWCMLTFHWVASHMTFLTIQTSSAGVENHSSCSTITRLVDNIIKNHLTE